MAWFSVLSAALIGWSAAEEAAPGLEVVYAGRLSQTEAKSPALTFNYHVLVLSADGARADLAWSVEERGAGGWQWPERFGEFGAWAKSQKSTFRRPALLNEYDGTDYVVPLPAPLFEYRHELRADAVFREGQIEYTVIGDGMTAERACWRVEAVLPRGRRQTFAVEKSTGLLVSLQERLVQGRGVPFELQVELQSAKKRSAEEAARWNGAWKELLDLQTALARNLDRPRAELSQAQIETTQAALKTLPETLAGTPWAKLSDAMVRDLQQQSRRQVGVAGLEKKFVGGGLPEFTLKSMNGMDLHSEDWKDQVVVLHFWEYPGDKLTEPYGQVGYLDFLNDKRKKLGVRIIGVAVDERFNEPSKKNEALRSVRKLQQFMNLGYDLALDSGDAVGQLGDPRKLNAKLPLWIVVGADGKIAHYKSGLYDMQPDEGLRALDEAILEAVKQRPR